MTDVTLVGIPWPWLLRWLRSRMTLSNPEWYAVSNPTRQRFSESLAGSEDALKELTRWLIAPSAGPVATTAGTDGSARS